MILVACEFSGTIRRALRARGYDAVSCDLLPAEDGSPHHYEGDVFDILDAGWRGMIAHPDCTYLTSSGLHWNRRRPGRAEKTEAALRFVDRLLNGVVERVVLENPRGCISTRIRRPDQMIQPYMFGDDASKETHLWLRGVPKLVIPDPAHWFPPRLVDGKKRWSNQTDSGQNRLAPSPGRAKERSRTYAGIGNAIADQLGPYLAGERRMAA